MFVLLINAKIKTVPELKSERLVFMNNKFKILAMVSAVCMLLSVIPAAAQSSISVADARLIKYDGNETQSLKAGDMYPEYDLENQGSKQPLMLITALFNNNKMIDVSYKEVVAEQGGSTVAGGKVYVPKASNDYALKAFLWARNAEPIPGGLINAVYNASLPTDIDGAKITIANQEFSGIVDNENRKIAFYVPVYQSMGSTKHMAYGVGAEAFDSAVKSLTPVFETDAEVAGAGNANDFRKPVAYTVSAEGKTAEYTVEVFDTVLQHSYGFDGGAYSGAAARNNLPAWHNSMGGNSMWTWSTSYDSRVRTSFDTDADNGENKVFTVEKTAADASADFRSYSGAPLFGVAQSVTSYKVKFDSLSPGGGVYIGGSNAEGNYSGRGAVVFTREGKEDGDRSVDIRFMKSTSNPGEAAAVPGESIELGSWVNVTAIEKNGNSENGKYYDIFEIYINGKYICTFGGEYESDLGLDAVHTAFYSFGDTTFKMQLDDYNIQYTLGTLVTESTKTGGGSVYTGARYPKADKPDLFIMGDSIAAEYNPSYAPLAGWSAPLRGMFGDDINYVNTALSGHRTSYYFEGSESRNWPVTYRFMRRCFGEGDYILLMLGPNESDMELFAENLRLIANDALYCGATLVLVTPTVYATYNPITNTGYTYARLMKSVAEEVPGTKLIDLNAKLFEIYSNMDIDEVRERYFVGTKRGAPAENPDYGHNVEEGAELIASLIRGLISESDSGLKNYLNAQDEKEITSFGVEADGKIFFGNMAGSNIFVDVPVKQAITADTYKDYGVSESKYDEAISSAAVHITAKGTVAGAGNKYDFTTPQTFTVTAADGSQKTYNVYVNKVTLQHAYGFEGALYSGASSRNYTPAWHNTMIGSSMWGWNDYSYDSTNIGRMENDPEDNSNQVYSVEKTDAGTDASFRSYSSAPEYAVKGLTTSYRVRFAYLNGDMYIGGAGAKEFPDGKAELSTGRHALVFTREGKAADDDSIDVKCVKTPDSAEKLSLAGAPALRTGEWINVTTVQENKENGVGGYEGKMHIIINGVYAGTVTDTYYRDFALKALHTGFISGEGSTYKVFLDDYSVSYVDGRRAAQGTQLYILGDKDGKVWGDGISKNFSSAIGIVNEALPGYTLDYYVNGSKEAGFSPKFEYISKYLLGTGDYVMIALGKYESDAEAFGAQLPGVIDAVKAKGATPVLVTPAVSYAQPPVNDTASVSAVIKAAAEEKDVVCLDLNGKMFADVLNMTSADYGSLYSGGNLSDSGAQYVVDALYELIAESGLPLKANLVAGSEKKIESVSVKLGAYTYEAYVDEEHKTISVYVPTQYYHTSGLRTYGIGDDGYNAAVKSVVPVFRGKGEVLNADAAQDFSTGAKTYTVRALDGTTVDYTMTLEKTVINYAYDFRTDKERTDNWGKNLPAWGAGVTGVNTWYWCELANNPSVTSLAGITADPKNGSNLALKVSKANGTDNANFFSTDGGITSGIKKVISEYKVLFTSLSAVCGEEASKGVFIGAAGGKFYEDAAYKVNLSTGRHALVFTREGREDGDASIDVRYISNGSETAQQKSLVNAPVLSLNVWHDVKYVHINTALGDGSFKGVTQVFIDGVYAGEAEDTYANDYNLNVAQMVFGSYNTAGSGLTTFDMYIDDFAVSYIK